MPPDTTTTIPDALLALAAQAEADKNDATAKTGADDDAARSLAQTKSEAASNIASAEHTKQDTSLAKDKAWAKLSNTRDQGIALWNTLYSPPPA